MTAVQETHNDYFGILEMFSDQNTQHEIDAANLKKACNKIKQTFLFFCFSGKLLISEQVRSTHKDGLLKHSKICKTWFSCYKYQITIELNHKRVHRYWSLLIKASSSQLIFRHNSKSNQNTVRNVWAIAM